MPPNEDAWPLPDYNPGPTAKQLHALGVLSLNYVKVQGHMDGLYFLNAPLGGEANYYALTEDKRSQAIKETYNDAHPDVAEAVDNLVRLLDWCRHCRNNLLHAESYPAALRRPSDDLFTLTKRANKTSRRQGYITLNLRQVRAIADEMFEGVRQCAKISLFLRYAGQPDKLSDAYRRYAFALPPKLIIPRQMKLAEEPEDHRSNGGPERPRAIWRSVSFFPQFPTSSAHTATNSSMTSRGRTSL